jgi:ankyrin repeat protein
MAVDAAAADRLGEALTAVRQSTPGGTARALTPAEQQKAIEAEFEFLRSSDEIQKSVASFTPDQLARESPSWNTPSGFKSDVMIKVRPQRETLVRKTGGMTALLFAARDGQIQAAEALLDLGADIDQGSGDGSTPLVIALLNGQFDLAMKLIERGADVNLASTTDGVAPLFAVLQTQWAFKFGDHPQPHEHESQKTEYMEVLNALLAKGANPNVSLKTHLWYSEMFEQKLGLDITGATPFWRATIAQDLPAMRALAEHGADTNTPTTMPDPGLRYGRQNDGRLQEDSGLPILPEGTPNMYPIHAAAGGGYLGLGAFMMNNVPNSFLPAVKFLVEEHGADVNQPDGWGYVPLHYAAVRGDNALIEYLVSKGANVKAVSRLGQSPVDMARGGRAGYFDRTYYPETVALLQGMGSPFLCQHTMFRGTGDWCEGSGVPAFETINAPGANSDTVNPLRRRPPTP